MTDRATCAKCGASVPFDLLAEHLAEHDPDMGTAGYRLAMQNAPIVDETDEGSGERDT